MRYLLIFICVIAFFSIGAVKPSFGFYISGDEEADSVDDEYQAADASLKKSSGEGKEAGRAGMEVDFENDNSGGQQQLIGDTIRAQDEIEDGD